MDNGSGSAAILEAARVLARIGPPPRRTIRFVWFMGEEHGLFGSTAYAEAHEDDLDRIVAVVNSDMAGEPRRFYAIRAFLLHALDSTRYAEGAAILGGVSVFYLPTQHLCYGGYFPSHPIYIQVCS